MRAMVMAAGAGTRLLPLTLQVPKPMVPVVNRPVLEYTVENLRKHGITQIIFNLHNHPDQIREHFGNGERWDVEIDYSYEPKLLGTAGGVKKVETFLKGGTFLVMSGDGLTNVNLTQLISFHRKRRSIGTLALKPIDARFEYGVTFTNKQGKIVRFVEKPAWSEVFSNLVNTGIYVFENKVFSKIPAGKTYDFGHDLWPRLLKEREPIFAPGIDAYWCDVGSIPEYRRAHRDALDGKTGIDMPGHPVRGKVWVQEGAVIDKRASLQGPCLIGQNSRIGAGSRIGPYTVIGHNAKIGRNATLHNTILWNNVTVGDNAHLEDSIVVHDARVSSDSHIYQGIILKN